MDKIQTAIELLVAYPQLIDALNISTGEALLMAYRIGYLDGEIAQLDKKARDRDIENFEDSQVARGRA